MLSLLNSIVANNEGLKKEVAEIIVDMLDENADNEEVMGTVENITTYGCVSGTVPALTYYNQTEAFFDRHANEIFELIAWEIRDELEAAMEFITDSEGNEY